MGVRPRSDDGAVSYFEREWSKVGRHSRLSLDDQAATTLNMLNYLGGSQRARGTVSPTVLAVLGLLAYRTLKGKGRLADLLGGSRNHAELPAEKLPLQD